MTPSFYKRGLSYFGAIIVGGALTAATLSFTSLSGVTGEFLFLETGTLNATSTVVAGELLTAEAGFLSQASSTVVGDLTVTGTFNSSLALDSSATLFTMEQGYISEASSTVIGDFTGTGNILFGGTLASTGLFSPAAGFISQSSSTVVGAFTATGAISSGGLITGTGLRVGSGATLATMLGTFQDLDFPAVLSGACSSTDMYLPGAVVDPINPMLVEVGVSPTFRAYATTTNVYGFVSATDFVTVNVCQPEVTATDPMGDPPISPFSVLVKQFSL